MTTAIQKTQQNASIAVLACEGMASKDIAEALNIDRSTVWRGLQTAEAKQIIETAQKITVVETASVAVELNDLCHHSDPAVKLSAIKQHQKITGISPSAINNVYIDKLVQDNRTQLISPEVAKALQGNDESFIDAEIDE